MFTHVVFGAIGLMYGYFTATGLKEKKVVIDDDPETPEEDPDEYHEKDKYKSEHGPTTDRNDESVSCCSTVYYIDRRDLNYVGRDKDFYKEMSSRPIPSDVSAHLPIRKGDYHGRKS
jgi:hypothetical protein